MLSSAQGNIPATSIPLSVPVLSGNESRYLQECVETNWVSSSGPYVDKFEAEFAAFVGSQHAVAVSSGTAAIHLALLAAGVQPDDEVVVPALTFIAPANAVRYVGAWPVILDVEAESWQLNPNSLANFFESGCHVESGELRNRKTGRKVSAILPVHILGHPVNMDPVMNLSRTYEIPVIEDSTESLGAKYGRSSTGTIGELGCFSFNGNKLITTGGGGMVTTNNGKMAERIRYLSTQARDDPLEYIHGEVGYNYRLNNIQAALGLAQLEQIDDFIKAKHVIANRYEESFAAVDGLSLMPDKRWGERMPWLYTVVVDSEMFGMGSRELIVKLGFAGIQARPLWEPLHISRVFLDGEKFSCPVAESLFHNAVSLPSSSNLTRSDQDQVIAVVSG
jgi:perosamine synthetase